MENVSQCQLNVKDINLSTSKAQAIVNPFHIPAMMQMKETTHENAKEGQAPKR